jgi:hypothetical protein
VAVDVLVAVGVYVKVGVYVLVGVNVKVGVGVGVANSCSGEEQDRMVRMMNEIPKIKLPNERVFIEPLP